MTKTNTNVRETVRAILAVNTEVASEVTTTVRNERGHPRANLTTITVTGAGVGTPFRRNYLKRKLAKLNAEGVAATVARTARKSGETRILVATGKQAEAVVAEVAA